MTPGLEQLARELLQATPALDAEEQGVAVELFRLLAEGEPVPPERLAGRLALPVGWARAAIATWPTAHRDEFGDVIAFWGLSLRETPIRLDVGGRRLHAWCAWDSLFIPQVLGRETRVAAACPVSGERISLLVGPGGVREVSPPAAALSFRRPGDDCAADIVRCFCEDVRFFSSPEAARRWTTGRAGTFPLSLDEGFDLGRMLIGRWFGAGPRRAVGADPGPRARVPPAA
jgi:alkylmercury lyase